MITVVYKIRFFKMDAFNKKMNPVVILVVSSIVAVLNRVPISTQILVNLIKNAIQHELLASKLIFSSVELKPHAKGFKLLLYGAKQQGSGASRKFQVETPPGHTGKLFLSKDDLSHIILNGIYLSRYFGKRTLKKPESFSTEEFEKCLKDLLDGFFYTLVKLDQTTVEVWYPTGRLHPSLKFQDCIESLECVCLAKTAKRVYTEPSTGIKIYIPADTSIPEMVAVYAKVFTKVKFLLDKLSGDETSFLILNMMKKTETLTSDGFNFNKFDFTLFELNRRYPIRQCDGCCEAFIWKKQVTTCCGGHSKFCIRCINQSIQSALDNTSAAQSSMRCQFGCDKALIDFSDGKVVILSGFKPVLNKDTNSKINAVALRLKETVDDSSKEARRAEALSLLEEHRRESPQDAYRMEYGQRTHNMNICPMCFTLAVRTYGCNAMICKCGTPFCIQCGTYDTKTNRCKCSQSITLPYFEGRLQQGVNTISFQIRGGPASQS